MTTDREFNDVTTSYLCFIVSCCGVAVLSVHYVFVSSIVFIALKRIVSTVHLSTFEKTLSIFVRLLCCLAVEP